MTNRVDLDALAGRIRLAPGVAAPNGIASTRPRGVAELAQGRPARELPALLAALHAQCAHAHRVTAQRAVDAALGHPQAPALAAQERTALRASTAREQLLRIVLDWPRRLPRPARAPDATLLLRSCPLWRDELALHERLADLPQWIEHKLIGGRPADWLAGWQRGGAGWAAEWCGAGVPAKGVAGAALRAQRDAMQALKTGQAPLSALADTQQSMPRLAREMARDGAFCRQPRWQGAAAETGPWTRHADPAPQPATDAFVRLSARLMDLLRLASRDGDAWLASGALPLGRGAAVAWTEMARGLLLHWVQLDAGTGPLSADSPVVACRVLAPTEWNFHPHGVMANALAELRPHDRDGACRLAVAFDPCVELDVVAVEPAEEACRA